MFIIFAKTHRGALITLAKNFLQQPDRRYFARIRRVEVPVRELPPVLQPQLEFDARREERPLWVRLSHELREGRRRGRVYVRV